MSAQAKIILVTGASSGIGRATADALHARGHVVYGGNRDPSRVNAPWTTIALDVTNDAQCERAVADIVARHGRLDVLVNNAGLVFAGAVEDITIDEARRQFDVNFFGALRLMRLAAPVMRERGSGLIINVSSLAGRLGLPFQGLYSASKFALEGLTESMRPELARFGVKVTLVEPGDIATNVVASRVRAAASGQGSAYGDDFEKVVSRYAKDEAAGASPDVVARRIASIIDAGNPAVRSTVGPLAQRLLVTLKPFVPSKLFEAGLMLYYGLRRR